MALIDESPRTWRRGRRAVAAARGGPTIGRLILPPRSIGEAGPVLGGLVLGIGAGFTLERLAMTQEGRRRDPEAGEPFGRIRGRPTTVTSVDGTRLHVEELGPRAPAGHAPGRHAQDPPTLVFSHGYALCGDAWHYQRRDLTAAYRCVFMDLRGHGRSGRSPTGDYSLTAMADDLAAVLAWTGDAPVVLVAHSMSGIAALRLIDRQPGVQRRLAGLVLVAANYHDNVRNLGASLLAWAGRTPSEVFAGAARQARGAGGNGDWEAGAAGPRGAHVRAGLRLLSASAKLLEHEPWLAHNLRRRGSDFGYLGTRIFGFGSNPSPGLVAFTDRLLAATDFEVWAQILPGLLDFDYSHVLPRIRVPTLVVVGDKDRIAPPGVARYLAGAIPDARLLVLPDSGHMAFMEEHERLDRALTAFVDEVT